MLLLHDTAIVDGSDICWVQSAEYAVDCTVSRTLIHGLRSRPVSSSSIATSARSRFRRGRASRVELRKALSSVYRDGRSLLEKTESGSTQAVLPLFSLTDSSDTYARRASFHANHVSLVTSSAHCHSLESSVICRICR